MLPIAHVGLGSLMARPLWRDSQNGLAWFWIVVGTLLPDLIDKPLYYVLFADAGSAGLVSGTRTFGHALFFPAFLLAIGALWKARQKVMAALAVGVTTHILLDHIGDAIGRMVTGQSETMAEHWPHVQGLFFPFLGVNFPDFPYANLREHASAGLRVDLLIAELLGAFFIARYLWLQRVGDGRPKRTRSGSKSPAAKRRRAASKGA